MKSGCKNPILPGNHSILNNKCSQQNIFTPRPSRKSNKPEIGRFWPNGAEIGRFRLGLAATRAQKFILFAGNTWFVAGRHLLLSIIPHCYTHSANNGRSTIFHILQKWWSGGGSTPHRIDPPPDHQDLGVFGAQRPVSSDWDKKSGQGIAIHHNQTFGTDVGSISSRKKSRIWWSGGGRRDPPLTTEFQVVRVR